jgi:hypothetical protein
VSNSLSPTEPRQSILESLKPGESLVLANANAVATPPPPASVGPYSYDEIAFAAEDQSRLSGYSLSPFDVRTRLIVQHGETFYILRRSPHDGYFHYCHGVQRGELPAALRQEQVLWPEVLLDPSGDPEKNLPFFSPLVMRASSPRPKSTSEIVQELATVARGGVIYSPASPRSYFLPTRGREELHLAVWQRRHELADQDPDPLVVEYFRLFGDDEGPILDWMATSSQHLSEPTSILTIVGPTGAGKNMILHGLARQWSEQGPVQAKQFLGQFNEAILRCPIVSIDEDLPTDPSTGRRLTTARLREISGESTFPIGIKFRSMATLHGALRIVVTINDLEAITTFNEDLNNNSMDAVASRILIVRATDAHARFLERIGGRAFTTENNWPDKIAAYALHLAKHHQVVRGSRFLVDGDGSALVGQMASGGAVASQILLAVANQIRRPHPQVVTSGAVRFGSGRVWINGEALLSAFEQLLPDDRRPMPQLRRVLKALTPLCDAEVVRPRDAKKRLRYRSLKLPEFYTWAETHDIDVDDLRKKITDTEVEKRTGAIGTLASV